MASGIDIRFPASDCVNRPRSCRAQELPVDIAPPDFNSFMDEHARAFKEPAQARDRVGSGQ
eukprot:5742819-Alexandrium_andersonii.AAC.1